MTLKSKKFAHLKKMKENSSNENQSANKNANQNCINLHIEKSRINDILEEKNIDVEIAYQTNELLSKSAASTLQEIPNYICDGIDPQDFNAETTP